MLVSLSVTWALVCCILFGRSHKPASLLKCCSYKSIADILPDGQPESLRRDSAESRRVEWERDRWGEQRRARQWCKNHMIKAAGGGRCNGNVSAPRDVFLRETKAFVCLKRICNEQNKCKQHFISKPCYLDHERWFMSCGGVPLKERQHRSCQSRFLNLVKKTWFSVQSRWMEFFFSFLFFNIWPVAVFYRRTEVC